ncbi:MAG: DUF445 family protein [Fusobacterium sp.]|uniref:DUF445 domain-containing protein n=1 Tax=Fusobacterium sp. TaxID=68766 RepID=UPI0026DCA72C|nr:DUF445 family protein [Fusobacterium sp.]MDO4691060.1 DUF445 family protein [Fusobacterium sp.]
MSKLIFIITISALIGWITNFVAIKMLFRPHREINFIFFKIQGLIPKRKHEIGEGIAETIEKELVSIRDIVEKLSDEEFFDKLDNLIDSILEKDLKLRIKEMFPFLQLFLNDKVLDEIKLAIKKIIFENKEEVVNFFSSYIEERTDFKKIIVDKISNFSLEKTEKLIFDLAKRELKHIEIIGAILGAIIGLFQYFIFLFV